MMNKTKLLKLARLLDRVPPEQFDMDTWAEREPGTKCATTACALGWGTTIFTGLVLLQERDDHGYVQHSSTGSAGSNAAMAEFDIDARDAEYLFVSGFDRTAKDVARDIREVVRRG